MAVRSVLAKVKPGGGVGRETRCVATAFDSRTCGYKQGAPPPRFWEDEEQYDNYLSLVDRRKKTGPPRRFLFGGPDVGYPYPQPKDSPKVTSYARLAVEHFNKQKNSQLRFVRVVKASCQQTNCGWGGFYYLTLEAVDDAPVVKTYQAIVNDYEDDPWLYMFGLVDGNGRGDLLKLMDNRVDYLRSFALRPIDSRNKYRYALTGVIRGPLQTEKGCFPKNKMLGSSSHLLPLQS